MRLTTKKHISIFLSLMLILGLCACAQQTAPAQTPVQETTNEVVVNTMPSVETTPEAPAVEAIAVNFGDVIENENIIMSIESADITEELSYKSGNVTSSVFIEDGKYVFYLTGNFENIGGNEIESWAFCGNLVVDDKYTYDVHMWSPSDLEPLVETPYYLYAEIPEKLVDSYTTAVFTFGFNNDFEVAFGDVESLDNQFTITVSK